MDSRNPRNQVNNSFTAVQNQNSSFFMTSSNTGMPAGARYDQSVLPPYQWTEEFALQRGKFLKEIEFLQLIFKHNKAALSQDHITMAVCAFQTTNLLKTIKLTHIDQVQQ